MNENKERDMNIEDDKTEKPGKDIEREIEERKKKLLDFLNKKKNLLGYIFLIPLIWLSTYIRTRNMYGLHDITTGKWTLGPDLDPFLFLRWARYIVEHGSLMQLDMMRYIPLGYNTSGEMGLLSYMIAYFYKFLKVFSDVSVEYAAVIFPVVMFVLTVIAFFLLTRKIFENSRYKDIIALVSSAFLIVSPSLLSRTIAGIPEKESVGFFFLFISFYFFLSAWKTKSIRAKIINSVLAGVMTAGMGLTWGGVVFIYTIIPLSVFFVFIFGKIRRREFLVYSLWLIVSISLTLLSSGRYSLLGLATSSSTGMSFAVFVILISDIFILKSERLKKLVERIEEKKRIPRPIISLIFSFIIIVLISGVIISPKFIPGIIKSTIDDMITPTKDRLGVTVAENRQPYYSEWKGSFGPVIKNFPLFFWLFFLGSVFLFYYMLFKFEKRERIVFTLSYLLMLSGIIFSRYSSSHRFNGINSISKIFYFGSILVFASIAIYYYSRNYREERLKRFKTIKFPHLFVFVFFFVSIVAARSAVRLIMTLAPPASIIIGFFSVMFFVKAKENKDETMKVILMTIAIAIILVTAYTLHYNYQVSKNSARGMVPSSYTVQWQKAMAWVRQNTAEDAVFAHWWDYGYWVQSIGNRATVLDGGNMIAYWDHLMGRHVLTGQSEREALEFLYTHNVTHLLIDPTDLGKYPAFSSIGSDENYDRYGQIPTFILNEQGTRETKNETIYVYQGGIPLDEDFLYKDNEGKEHWFPAYNTGIGGVFVKTGRDDELLQPEIVLFYQNKQTIPLRYLYYKEKLYDFENGYEGVLYIIPKIDQTESGINVNEKGAGIFLTERIARGLLAKIYLLNQAENFELVHSEHSMIVENLRSQGLETEFLFFGGTHGPIKIWKVNYPADIKANPAYLETRYPKKELSVARR